MRGPAYWRAGTPGSILRGRWFDSPKDQISDETEFEISLGSGQPDREPLGWKGYRAVDDDPPVSLENHWSPLYRRNGDRNLSEPLLVDPDVDDPLECFECFNENSYVFCDARDAGDYFLRGLHTLPFRGWVQTSEEAPFYYQPDRMPWGRTGSEPTLVMTHGYTGNPDNWTHFAGAMDSSSNGYAVPMLPGHGLPAPEFAAFDAADWTNGLKTQLNWLKDFSHDLVGIGLSMGGALNLIHWKKFEALVVINTPYFVPDWRRFLLPVMKLLRTYHRFEESDKTIPVKSLEDLKTVLARSREVLESVGVPVLVINHREDETVTVNHGKRFKNRLPDAEHLVLEEGIHESPTQPDVAEQLNDVIFEWLNEKGFSV